MTAHPSGSTPSPLPRLRRALRLTAYRTFYGLPPRMRRLLVRWGTPSYTVGTLILVRDADAPTPGRLLLLRQPPGPGWSLPGGLLDRGERPVEGALRELAEETGLRLRVEDLEPAVPNAIVHTNGRWVDIVFWASAPADATFTLDEAEVYDAVWHPLDDLPPLTSATARLVAHYGLGPLAAHREER